MLAIWVLAVALSACAKNPHRSRNSTGRTLSRSKRLRLPIKPSAPNPLHKLVRRSEYWLMAQWSR